MGNGGINIKPDREYFREIVEKVSARRYAVPVFQRDFVWDQRQILDFFDSIVKGYPIGTILLWKPPTDEPYRYKDILTDRPAEGSKVEYYILDGRQRLTTFYGCVSQNEKKREDFRLYYDLEKESFVYLHATPKLWQWPVSDIYDTLSLLKRGQAMVEMDDTQLYIERARKLNSILQQYVVGEIIMNDGTLEEARMAFTRLNSKGTPISDWEMLQARSFKNEDDQVLGELLNEIRLSLEPYGFQEIKEDEILNCCYRYAGKRYMEKLKDLEGIDIKPYLEDVKRDLGYAARFLHDDCRILSKILLPYAKQVVPICYFFKLNPNPSAEKKKELIRWIFYMIYTQQLSGSLTNLRLIFDRVDKFSEGANSTAWDDYQPVAPPKLDFAFATGNAKPNFLLISQIHHRLGNTHCCNERYEGNYTMVTGSPAGVAPLINEGDFNTLRRALKREEEVALERYCLNSYLVQLFNERKYKEFLENREVVLCRCERDFLEWCGISVKE